MKTGTLVRKNYELSCIAPVHIGSGEKLAAFEYLYDAAEKFVYFLDASKWIVFLEQRGLMEEYAAFLERRSPHGKNLWDWLSRKGVQKKQLQALSIRRAKAVKLTAEGEAKDKLNDIICQTTLADGTPYIPGSAIKGALRTGILHGMIKKEPRRFQRFWQEFLRGAQEIGRSGNPRGKKGAWRRLATDVSRRLEQEALHALSLPPMKTRDAVTSALRGLRVGDAVCEAGEKDTVVLQKLDATTKRKRDGTEESEIPLFRECLPAGRRLRFSLTADFSMLETVGITSCEEIFAALRAYTQDGLKRQEAVWGKNYAALFKEAAEADCLLGGGTGFLSKTLIYALAGADEEAHRMIAMYLDDAFANHKHKALDSKLSPRTLKMAELGQELWILGLCAMRESGR